MAEEKKTKVVAKKTIFAKYRKALEEMPEKLEQAQGYGYKYTPLPVIMKAIKPVLAKHGLGLMQRTTSKKADDKEYLAVETIIFDDNGDMLTSGEVFLPLENIINKGNMAQSGGAIITYLRRYSLSALLGLATEEDTDAHSEGSYTPSKAKKPAEKKPEPKKEYPEMPNTVDFLLQELGYTNHRAKTLWQQAVDKYGDKAEDTVVKWINEQLEKKEQAL